MNRINRPPLRINIPQQRAFRRLTEPEIHMAFVYSLGAELSRQYREQKMLLEMDYRNREQLQNLIRKLQIDFANRSNNHYSLELATQHYNSVIERNNENNNL